jgi:hypothetical protein
MKIPDCEHWAIITTTSTYVPGDERSRTNPGHGYPEHTVESINYDAYTDYAKFQAAVEHKVRYHTTFKAVHVTPMTIETKVIIK